MKRRTVLSKGIGVAAGTAAVAGCIDSSGGGDGDSNDGNAGDDTGEGSTDDEGDGPSPTGESGMARRLDVSPASVQESVSVVAIEEVEAAEKRLELDITLRNTADQAAPMDHYGIILTGYAIDEPREDSNQWIRESTQREYDKIDVLETPPGETVTLGYSIDVPSDADATIESYAVTVTCDSYEDPLPPGCE